MVSLHDSAIAVIRTAVPSAMGIVFAWLLSQGVSLPDDLKSSVVGFFVVVVITVYYAIATWLERNVHPAFGWLLGAPHAPTYEIERDGDG